MTTIGIDLPSPDRLSPTTTRSRVGHGRMLRKEDPRFIRGTRQLRRRRPAARHAAPGHPALAVRARPDRQHRHQLPHRHIRRSRRWSPAPTWPKRVWPGCRRCPTTCRRCWPPTRCGSRARRWPSSSPRTATPPATRWSSSTSSTTPLAPGRSTRARRSTPDAAGDPRPTSRARPTTTASTGRPATRRPPRRRSRQADVVVKQDIVYPRVHPGADGDLRRGRRSRPGRPAS